MTLGQRCDEIIRLIDDVLRATSGEPATVQAGRGGGHALLEVGLAPARVDTRQELWA